MLKPTNKMRVKRYLTYIVTLLFQIANNKGAVQTAQMDRLVCAFVVRQHQSHGFSRRGPYDVEAQASWPPPAYALRGYTVFMLFVIC